MVTPPLCIECGQAAKLSTTKIIYPHRRDLWGRSVWLCDCGAYCGCHKSTQTPLGNPCGPETRKARMAAHAAFDPLWMKKIRVEGVSKGKARRAGYAWLSDALNLTAEMCHIGMMNRQDALRVVDVCLNWKSLKGKSNLLPQTPEGIIP